MMRNLLLKFRRNPAIAGFRRMDEGENPSPKDNSQDRGSIDRVTGNQEAILSVCHSILRA
jgi:hypothetical protein